MAGGIVPSTTPRPPAGSVVRGHMNSKNSEPWGIRNCSRVGGDEPGFTRMRVSSSAIDSVMIAQASPCQIRHHHLYPSQSVERDSVIRETSHGRICITEVDDIDCPLGERTSPTTDPFGWRQRSQRRGSRIIRKDVCVRQYELRQTVEMASQELFRFVAFESCLHSGRFARQVVIEAAHQACILFGHPRNNIVRIASELPDCDFVGLVDYPVSIIIRSVTQRSIDVQWQVLSKLDWEKLAKLGRAKNGATGIGSKFCLRIGFNELDERDTRRVSVC